MGLKITYEHNHGCKHAGEEVESRPDNSGGVSWITVPICEETMMELARVKVEKY